MPFLKLQKLARYFAPEAAPVSALEKLRGGLAAFVVLLAVGYVASLLIAAQFIEGRDVPLLIGSMGASILLLFAAPHSPMSQPWPLVGGHLLSALIGVTCIQHIPYPLLASAAAVALSIVCMQWLHCLHPPGAATALIATIGGAKLQASGYYFLLAPVGINLAVLLPLGILFNNLLPGRRYPAQLFAPKTERHQHHNPSPMDRLGISEADIQSALTELNSYLDVSRDDLNDIYNRAGMLSYQRRLGEITCKDIMSKELTTAEFATELEDAWRQLHAHKIKAIPVIDRARRVIGIVTIVDFLKHAKLAGHDTLRDRVLRFVRRTPGIASDKAEVVGQIMTSPVMTVAEDMHIVRLVPLLSDRGLHHIPVVNAENRLVGMITQSDLIAALYRGQLAGG